MFPLPNSRTTAAPHLPLPEGTREKEMRMQPPAHPSLTGHPERTWHERLPPCCCCRCVTTSAASPCARTVPAHVKIGQIWGAGLGAQVQRCLKTHKTLHSQKREAGTERRPTSHLCLSPASHESELCSGDPNRTPTRHHQTHDANPISSQSLMKCLFTFHPHDVSFSLPGIIDLPGN